MLPSKRICSISRKVHFITSYEGPEGEWIYTFTLSLTSGLDGVGAYLHAPGSFIMRKETSYRLKRRLGGLEGRSELVRKKLPQKELDIRVIQWKRVA